MSNFHNLKQTPGEDTEGVETTKAMDVVDKTGSTWRVLRRYNHFDAFRKALRCKRLPRSAAFPGRGKGAIGAKRMVPLGVDMEMLKG